MSSNDANDNVLNEVHFSYAPNRQLKWLFQSHDGPVDVEQTPHVEYQYDKRHRLTGMAYPSGKELSYGYDAAGRVVAIYEGLCSEFDDGSSGEEPICNDRTEIVRYLRDGTGRFMQTTYVQPGISLDCHNGGLDRFGRIVNHTWRDTNGTALVQISHGYDLSGNRTSRQDGVNASRS